MLYYSHRFAFVHKKKKKIIHASLPGQRSDLQQLADQWLLNLTG